MASKEREYRSMDLRMEPDTAYMVTGYASTFEPYTIMEFDGVDYREQIDPHAFDECDMSDCVFRVDHAGPVYARTSNGLLSVSVDEHGLKSDADLSKTQRARALFEDIQAGNYAKMSFAFTVREDKYDSQEHLRTITKIDKLYDVSPVTFPANPGTEISARSWCDGVIEQEQAERLALAQEAENRKARREAVRKKIIAEKIREVME